MKYLLVGLLFFQQTITDAERAVIRESESDYWRLNLQKKLLEEEIDKLYKKVQAAYADARKKCEAAKKDFDEKTITCRDKPGASK